MNIAQNNVLLLIKYLAPSLSLNQKKIADCILSDPEKVKWESINEFAQDCGSSIPSVSRFVKRIGIRNYPELKIAIAEALSESNAARDNGSFVYNFLYPDIVKGEAFDNVVNKIFFKATDLLKITRNLVSMPELEKAVAAIARAKKIVIYCSGASLSAGQNFKIRFYKIGKDCILYNDSTEQAVSSALLNENYFVLGISNSGRTKSVINALKTAKGCGAICMCITSVIDAPIVKYADIKFFTSTQPSISDLNSMISRIPDLVIIDMIYACYISRHYNQSLKMMKKSTEAFEQVVFDS